MSEDVRRKMEDNGGKTQMETRKVKQWREGKILEERRCQSTTSNDAVEVEEIME